MIVRAACAAVQGVNAFPVDLEVDFLRQGMPVFSMVGLAEGALREARERVFAALRSCGFKLPSARITINLAPADRKKTGSGFDLPVALGLLAASGILDAQCLDGWFFVGELSLTGEIKSVPGVLPIAVLARKQGAKGILVPKANAAEAAVVDGLPVYALESLGQAADFLQGKTALQPEQFDTAGRFSAPAGWPADFSEVKGQEHAKRAIEIAAAGGHNLLFIGPPGSGKTMLAQRIPTVLPPLTFDEALEVTTIYSVANLLDGHDLMTRRPFRSPHHSISDVGLTGGSSPPKPGEVSLSHRGVLFLDELPEFRKPTLEGLRQPLEDGRLTIARAAMSLTYPADFMLVAAMNPCPCGFATDPHHQCTCSPSAVQRYRARLSGPLLDRIDLHVEVPAVPYEDLRTPAESNLQYSSAAMTERIMAARDIQQKRFAAVDCRLNADLNGSALEEFCAINQAEQEFLGHAVRRLALSARAYTRILRISRTIADLAGTADIKIEHIAEAVNCRSLDREKT